MLIIFLLFNLTLFLIFNKFYNIIGIYDRPNTILKIHDKKMPVYGGIIFFLNFILFFFLDIFYFNTFFEFFNRTTYIFLLISSSAIFLMGLLDDKFELDAKNKTYK